MNVWIAKAVIVAASIVLVVIRAPHGQRSRGVQVARSYRGTREVVLLTHPWNCNMTTKTFDAVGLMRELRDKLSHEMELMTPEERLRYIRDKAAATDLGRRLAEEEDGTHPTGAAGRPGTGR